MSIREENDAKYGAMRTNMKNIQSSSSVKAIFYRSAVL